MFSLTGVSPPEGSKRNPLDTLIEFTIVDDGTGINSSTLIVQINGVTAVEGSDFKPGFAGIYSDINPVGSNLSVVINPENTFEENSIINIKIQVQNFLGKYNNFNYSFKVIENKPEKIDKGYNEQLIKKVKGDDNDTLLIGEDLQKLDYKLSNCCNPIPGDDVFGFVTVGDGIKIHRTNCPNAAKLMSNYGYRIVKAKWNSQKELAFLTGLHITGIDDVGLINKITKVISSDFKVNMRSITVDTDDGIFEGSIMVYVNNTKHLDNLINKLKEVVGVTSVSRFDSNPEDLTKAS